MCSTSPPQKRNSANRSPNDLREGKATLAVIHTLNNDSTQAEREAINAVLSNQDFEHVSHEEILRILKRNQSVNYAMKTASAYAEAAWTALAPVSDSELKRALQWMSEFCRVTRAIALRCIRL